MTIYIFALIFRSDQKQSETGAMLDVKAVFASLSALSFPIMPTCEGIHAIVILICGDNFLRRV